MKRILQIIASAPKGATPERLRKTKAAIAILLLFPFVLFGEDFTLWQVTQVYSYRFKTFSSTSSYTQEYQIFRNFEPYTVFSSVPFSISLDKFSGGVSLPSFSSTLTNSSVSISFPIRAIPPDSSSSVAVSPFAYPDVSSLIHTAAALYWSGYRGPGIVETPSTSSYQHIPLLVDWKTLISDIASSTNAVYRQILLSHLSSISTSVQNIEVNMSGVQSAVEQGNASLSNIIVVASDILDVVHTNFVAVSNISDSVSLVSSNSVDILRGVDLLHDDWLASSIDVFLGDDTEAWVNFLNMAVDQGLLSESDASQYAATLRATDPTLLKGASKSYSIPAAHRRFFAKNSIKGTVVEAQQMRGRYQTFRNWTNQRGEMFGAMDATWSAVAGDRINSIVGSHVNDWRYELRQQLQDWKTSDEHGILNVKKSIDDNFSSPDPRFPGSTNSVPFTFFQTNFVTRPLTNSIHDASKQIQSNATANVDRQLEADNNRWDEFKSIATGVDGEGINVNIRNPLWEKGGLHVNVRDDAVVQAIQDGVLMSSPELIHISDAWDSFLGKYSTTNSLDWQPWFEKWDPFSAVVSNYYAQYDSSLPAAKIAKSFLETGFDFSSYEKMPWFQRVEVLLAMIAGVDTNSVWVADIEEDMEDQASAFQNLSTNVVSASSDVVGLFDYVKRFSLSLQSVFGDRAAPLTGDYVLLSSGHWIGDEPLTLRINPNIQNFCRLVMQCIWYLAFLVLLWVVVNWVWSKVVAVLRWLWSMFDV